MTGDFIDTNILVYAFSRDPRSVSALALLETRPVIAVQNLNEFINVARNKLKEDWVWVHEALDRIRSFCSAIVPLDLALHGHGAMISERYKLRIYDSLIIAAAIRRRCEILWSEDMQNGLVVEGLITIRNPFAQKGAS